MNDLEQQLTDALRPAFAGPGLRSPFAKADVLIPIIFDLLKDGADRDTVIAAVDRVWATTVVPYNIPYIPEFIERRIEQRALDAIHEAIGNFFEGES